MSLVGNDVEDLGRQMVITNWALDAACGAFLGLRLYCKFSRRRALWWDDHFLVSSWVGFLSFSAADICTQILVQRAKPMPSFPTFLPLHPADWIF
jgi:hypothetical protein